MNPIRYYCMPADFKKETIDRYDELNRQYEMSKIIETYGNISIRNSMESGRVSRQLPEVDLYELKEYIQYSKEKNIDFNYTLNGTHMNNFEFSREGVLKIRQFLESLYQVGVRSLTLALPSLIELVKSLKYDFKIKASTLCQIINANKALAYKNMGVERIVVDESINRDFGRLKQIRNRFGDGVEMIVNPICLKDCTYRMFHYNQISSDSKGKDSDISVNFYEHRCVLQRNRNVSNLLRMCWVRPEDIKYYASTGINYFKLQGRQLVHTGGDALRTIQAYFKEDFDGDLLDIINMFRPINSFNIRLDNKKLEGFIKPFYENENFCRRDCEACNYCDKYAKNIIDFKKAKEIIQLAGKFYNEYDKFMGMLKSFNGENSDAGPDSSTVNNIDNCGFDF